MNQGPIFSGIEEDDDTRHRCQNCGGQWKGGQLQPIADFAQRVSAGEPCPSGECPECGALCQPIRSDKA